MPVLEERQTTEIAFSALLHQYTLEEFFSLPDPGGRAHYELIEGVLYMVPPPDPPHGDVGSYLNASLVTWLAAHGWPGRVYHPREPIYKNRTYLEPDMMYVSNELRAKMGKRRTSADIVFEYLSPSTANYDRTTKADTYLALGVRELWLIDSEAETIEVRHALAKRSPKALPRWESHIYLAGESSESRVLEGWRVSVDELLASLK